MGWRAMKKHEPNHNLAVNDEQSPEQVSQCGCGLLSDHLPAWQQTNTEFLPWFIF